MHHITCTVPAFSPDYTPAQVAAIPCPTLHDAFLTLSSLRATHTRLGNYVFAPHDGTHTRIVDRHNPLITYTYTLLTSTPASTLTPVPTADTDTDTDTGTHTGEYISPSDITLLGEC
jgi:hypothetical protein